MKTRRQLLVALGAAAMPVPFETARLLLERAGARNELGKAMRARAEVARRDGEPEAARDGFEQARALFEELGTLDEPGRVRVALATLDGATHPA